jgi:predicted DsbA family dithiol-disulfide isomerase
MLPQDQSTLTSTPVIEVVSDVVCPWCFIGKRRIEKALTLLGLPNARLKWKAFQLNPDAPPEGLDRQAYRTRKFGSMSYAKQLEARVAAAGAGEGIDFQFDRIRRVPNTFQAHRLIWLADREGVQDSVVEKLFQAYFVDALDIGDAAVLRRMGADSGIPDATLDSFFATDMGASAVRAEELQARRLGVNGVPAFFVDGRQVAAGADIPERLAAALGPVLVPGLTQCSLNDDGCAN